MAHGGRLIEARQQFPDAPAPFIDLSTGINPHAYPLGALPACALTRLPEPETLLELQERAAAAYGAANGAMVAAAPGTQILIGLLPSLLRCKTVSILGPTYGGHAAAWRAAGSAILECTDADRFCDRAPRTAGAAVLCNPNNPDGRSLPAARLRRLADAMARRGGWLICDEAFADLQDHDESLAGLLPRDGLLVLRSFGKTYGLPGLRLGFLLASPRTAGRIRAHLGDWPVSGPALAAGIAALGDNAWRDAMRHRLRHEGARLDRMLEDAALALVGGTALFRLYRGHGAAALWERLAKAGILVRRFDHDDGLIRLGLPGCEPEWARLAAALVQIPAS